MLVNLTYSGSRDAVPQPAAAEGPGRRGGQQRRDRTAVTAGGAVRAGGDPALALPIRRAEIRDMAAVAPLINRFAERNLMLAKSDDQLVRSFREFLVAEDETGRIVGCGALRVYSADLAEVISLAVDESYQGSGIGRRIVEGLLEEAKTLGIRNVFALTLRENFFHRIGFVTVPKELFPLKVWADCRACPKLHACDEIAVVKEL